MSVDMYQHRFFQELLKNKEFRIEGWRSEDVWRAKFPAWRAVFSAACLFGHGSGYKIPSYKEFFDYCRVAFTKRHPHKERYKKYFEGPLLEGMKERTSVWYESGIAETHLYVCLIEAIEDKGKCGLVLYDPRADWKLKADLFVVLKGSTYSVSSYFGEKDGRSGIEKARDVVERDRKRNTSESSHWDNTELDEMKKFEISRTEQDQQIVNGLRLFSTQSVNRLLNELYHEAGIEGGPTF